CLTHNIIPLCLPAHSTAPLDVCLFGPLQRNYGDVLDDWLQDGNAGIHKGTFYSYNNPNPIPKTRILTETSHTLKKNIQSAFAATGIILLNPRAVLQQ
ncbi:hypothetical protein P167DRAFT_465044, partial [Morchella conica CCBAS932]